MMTVLQLSQSERDELLQHLDERQRTLINEYLKRGRKTVYTNVLPKGRGGNVPDEDVEQVASQWDYIDADTGWKKAATVL